MPHDPHPALTASELSIPAPFDRAADAAMMLAAVERMETMMRGERAAFERLRADLDDMASTVALAKAALASFAIKPDDAAKDKSGDVNELLQAIEDRVKAMVAFIDVARIEAPADAATEPKPAALELPVPAIETPAEAATGQPQALSPDIAHEPEPAEHDHVPTVSDVVSQLGRAVDPESGDAPSPAAASQNFTNQDFANQDFPNQDVPSVAMLETLVEALTASMPEVALPEPELVAVSEPLPAAEPVNAAPEPVSAPESQPEPEPPAPVASGSALPDIDLMASFARIASMPILLSDIGTAVIFPSREIPLQAEPEPTPAPTPAAEPTPDGPPAMAAEAAPLDEPPAELPDADEADPAEFLYEPDPDPASFLLEPIWFVPQSKPAPSVAPPSRPAVAILPPVLPPVLPPIAPATPVSQDQPKVTPPAPLPEVAAPRDPLAALKAMSDDETIALFS